MAKRVPASLRGKTIRWSFTEGPAKGTTYQHVFNKDGSVRYRDVVEGKPKGKGAREKKCAVDRVTRTVHVISYLASSGYTLTVVLNFEDMSMRSFASNEKSWFPAKGTFEIVR